MCVPRALMDLYRSFGVGEFACAGREGWRETLMPLPDALVPLKGDWSALAKTALPTGLILVPVSFFTGFASLPLLADSLLSTTRLTMVTPLLARVDSISMAERSEHFFPPLVFF